MDRPEIIETIRMFANEELVSEFIPGKTYIPAASPVLRPQDVATLGEVLLQFWYTEWKYCRKFERALEKVTRKEHITLTNSGSSASLVATTAAIKMAISKRHPKYQENAKFILTCATGFPTTVTPIIQNGMTPLFVDITPDLLPNLDHAFALLEADSDHEILGAVFAHNLGFPYDEYSLWGKVGQDRFLIADCCDALGAGLPTRDVPVGNYSDLSFMSFFPSHHIMAAEGGAVAVHHPEYHALVDSLVNWGRSCYCRPGENNTCGKRFSWEDRGSLPEGWDHKYIFSEIGYNLKMTEFQGALGWSQIQYLDQITQARRTNYAYLYRELSRYAEHIRLIPANDYFSPFGFPVQVDGHVELNDLVRYLEEHKIGTRRLFGGNLTRQPMFQNVAYAGYNNFPVSDILMNNLFWINVGPSLTEPMLEYMVYVFDQYFIERGLA